MWYYDDGLDYSKPVDREHIEKRKRRIEIQLIERINNVDYMTKTFYAMCIIAKNKRRLQQNVVII